MSRHHAHVPQEGPCPNCQHPLEAGDRYCSRCGQQRGHLQTPLSHVAEEAIEGLYHLDGKVFTTLRGLFLRFPGKITQDYLDGRRQPYLPPIRIYTFTSILLFALLNIVTSKSIKEAKGNSNGPFKKVSFHSGFVHYPPAAQALGILERGVPLDPALSPRLVTDSILRQEALRDTLLALVHRQAAVDTSGDAEYPVNKKVIDYLDNWQIKGRVLAGQGADTLQLVRGPLSVRSDTTLLEYLYAHPSDEILDSILAARNEVYPWYKRRALRVDARINHLQRLGQKELFEAYIKSATKSFSLSMFLMMPAAAGIMMIFYHRRRRYYVEHLMLSIHGHTVVFVLALISLTFSYFAGDKISEDMMGLVLLLGLIWFIVAQIPVYRVSLWRAILNTIGMGLLYIPALLILVVTVLIIGVVLI